MEVVCLILGPMLASQPCLPAFWVLTSLHLLSFLLKMFFIILVFIVFFLNGVNIFFCRLQKYYNYIIMKSCNQKCIKICSSMKVSLLYLGIDYHSLSLTDGVYSLFTYSTVCSPTSSVSHCVNHSVFQCLS